MNLWPFLTIPILTELLTGSQPFSKFFTPGTYIFLFFAYSVPAVMIHELKVRRGLGLIGLFILGLAYGIFNEGVLAKTLLMSDATIPVQAFMGYSTCGINIPWMATILPWHALYSIVYPLAIFYTLYPKESSRTRISNLVLITMVIFYLVIGSIVFFNYGRASTWAHLIFFWALIMVLTVLSIILDKKLGLEWPKQGKTAKRIPLLKGLIIGFPLTLLLLIPMAGGGMHLPMVIQLIIDAAMYIFVYWRFNKNSYLHLPFFTVIAVGHYLSGALLSTMLALNNIDCLLGEVVVFGLLGYFLWRINRRQKI